MERGRTGTLGCIRRATGLKPLNGLRLNARLLRDGSPAQTTLSEYRLQPEVCEGLQARVVGLCKALGAPHTPVGWSPNLQFCRNRRSFGQEGRPSVSSAWVQQAPQVVYRESSPAILAARLLCTPLTHSSN